jgi:hypothetical protein
MAVSQLPVGAVLLVVLVSVVSGPLVPWVDLTRAPPAPGAGTASASVESVPSEVRLVRERFGAGRYRLDAPAAVVGVDAVRGRPVLRYVVDVPALSFVATSERPLAGRDGDRVTLAVGGATASPRQVDRESYEATVAVWLREGPEYTALVQREVTVEVVG